MPIDDSVPPGNPWTRKHDDPRTPLFPDAARIVYPKTLEEIIDLCKNRPASERLKAAGSHWALSHAAISDHTFIETHDPRGQHRVLGKTLDDVIPHCLTREYLEEKVASETSDPNKTYLVHVEAGKRIYQLYAELDQPIDDSKPTNLAGVLKHEFKSSVRYAGPWAFKTLGGAGGQTVVGAISTGTHGGDFDLPPIADSVVAIHLVADGGKQYWIESTDGPPLADPEKLNTIYPGIEYKRGNEMFNAVLVSAGRFGVIYSVVLKAVPQFMLCEQRNLKVWQEEKDKIWDQTSWLFNEAGQRCRFLMIAVCLTTHANFTKNLIGVTRRWEVKMQSDPSGRMERVGDRVNPLELDQRLQAPLFKNAGNSYPYSPDEDDTNSAADPTWLMRACAAPNFLKGVVAAVADDIDKFVNSSGSDVGFNIANIATGGVGLVVLLGFFSFIRDLLKYDILRHLEKAPENVRLGETLEYIKNTLLANEKTREAGMAAWQMIADLAFRQQQSERKYDAISYAVMDQKNYRDINCEVNVDSVEVFFSLVRSPGSVEPPPDLINFVDALILFEMNNEYNGNAFVGYASLRFMGSSRATLAMQQWETTCSVEVACLRDVVGSQALVDFAVNWARNNNNLCTLHWGQRNDYTKEDVDFRYANDGAITSWRAALAEITDNGRLDGFSSAFTRKTGLEVV
ncbi:MAG: hypothetical protein JJE04_03985 [Acidobacteriia bacterium]|nr:hypothetical protein [Terriglobia bacterium]